MLLLLYNNNIYFNWTCKQTKKKIARCKQTKDAVKDIIDPEKIDFVVADATQRLPFEDESVDKVVTTEAMFHFDPRSQFFEEAHRILKPGGTFGFVDLVVLPSRNCFHRFILNCMTWSGLLMPESNTYSAEQYYRLLEKSGFSIVEKESIMKDVVPPYLKYNVCSRWYWYALQPECLLSFGFMVYPFDYIRVRAIKV